MAALGIKDGGPARGPLPLDSVRAVAVLVLFEIVHVLEVFVSFLCDPADVLTETWVARAVVARVARASLAGTCVLLVRADAIVGHGLSFSGECDQRDSQQAGCHEVWAIVASDGRGSATTREQ